MKDERGGTACVWKTWCPQVRVKQYLIGGHGSREEIGISQWVREEKKKLLHDGGKKRKRRCGRVGVCWVGKGPTH